MAFLGKFAYIGSYYHSIPVPYGDWKGWWFEHLELKTLKEVGTKNI